MITSKITEIDIQILNWIQEHMRCGFLDAVMPKATHIARGGIFFIAVALILLCFKDTRVIGIKLAAALLLGLIFGNLLIKPTIARIRPYDLVGMTELLVKPMKDFSFPSGHTLASLEFATVICLTTKKWWIKLFPIIIAILVPITRMYLYVHYPSDVIAGAVLGLVFGIMAVRAVDMIIEEKKEAKTDVSQ